MKYDVDKIRVTVFPDGRVSRHSAALLLGRKSKTLADWKLKGWGPKPMLVGGRIFYDFDEVLAMARGEMPVAPSAAA